MIAVVELAPRRSGNGAAEDGPPSCHPSHRDLLVGMPHPDRCCDVRSEADEPSILGVLGRAGLAACRHAVVEGSPSASTATHVALEGLGDHSGGLHGDGSAAVRAMLVDDVAVAVLDALDVPRLVVDAVVGEAGVGTGLLDDPDLFGSQRKGEDRIEWGGNSKAASYLDHLVVADNLTQTNERTVVGGPCRRCDRDPPPTSTLDSVWIGVATGIVEGARAIASNPVARGVPGLEEGCEQSF